MLLATIMSFSFVSIAQQPTGLLFSERKYREVPQMQVTGEKFNNLPLKVSLKKYCPVAGDQRSIGACVGWATGYGAMTILMAQKLGMSNKADITEKALSAAFVYNQVKVKSDNCADGAYLEDALDLLKSKGDCLEKNFNFERTDCKSLPVSKHFQEAQSFKIKDYAAVFELEEAGNSKIAKVCKILSKETPIVVGIGVTPSFWQIRPGTTTWNPENTEGVTGNHAMLLVGYDNIEKEFELMNSFGAAWGKNGFIKIKFEDFERLCKFAFLLMANDETAKTTANASEIAPKTTVPPLSGAFVFRKPAGYLTTSDGDEVPYFEEVTTFYDPATRIYRPVQGTFKVGDAFQLVARQIPRGRYAYVFSQSQSGQVNLHFPKDNIANFVIDKDAEIIIPNEETILQIPEVGDDHLCIVYANNAIPDFEQRFEKFKKSNGEFGQKVKIAFGDILTPPELVQFEANKMAFLATPPTMKSAVALILKVTAK